MPNVSFPNHSNTLNNNNNNNNNNLNYVTGMGMSATEGMNTNKKNVMNTMNNANVYQSISLDIDRLMLFSYNIQDYFNGKNYTLNIANNVRRGKNKGTNIELNAFQSDFERYTPKEKNAFREVIRVVTSVSHIIGFSKQNGRIGEDKLNAMLKVFLAINEFNNTLSNGSKRSFFVKNIDRKIKTIKQMLVNQTVQGMTDVGPSVSTTNKENITRNNANYFGSTNNACVPLYKERDELIIKIFKKCPHLLPSQIPLSCDDLRKIRNFVMTQCKHKTNKINLKK